MANPRIKHAAAMIALALIEDLEQAGCTLPHVKLHTDCSGRFVTYEADQTKAMRVFEDRLGREQVTCQPALGGMHEWSFTAFTLLRYKEAWPYGGPVPDDHPRKP